MQFFLNTQCALPCDLDYAYLIMQLIFNRNDAISQYAVRSTPCCCIEYRRKNTEKRRGLRCFSSNNYGHRGGISGSKYSQVSSVKVHRQKFHLTRLTLAWLSVYPNA